MGDFWGMKKAYVTQQFRRKDQFEGAYAQFDFGDEKSFLKKLLFELFDNSTYFKWIVYKIACLPLSLIISSITKNINQLTQLVVS
jgi:hypothetical protein